jgi:hypothetical protein
MSLHTILEKTDGQKSKRKVRTVAHLFHTVGFLWGSRLSGPFSPSQFHAGVSRQELSMWLLQGATSIGSTTFPSILLILRPCALESLRGR